MDLRFDLAHMAGYHIAAERREPLDHLRIAALEATLATQQQLLLLLWRLLGKDFVQILETSRTLAAQHVRR